MKISERIRQASRLLGGASEPWIARAIEKAILGMQNDLAAAAKKYTGGPKSNAKIDRSNQGIRFLVWLDFSKDPEVKRSEIQETAEVILGQGARISPHKMVQTMWIAEVTMSLPS